MFEASCRSHSSEILARRRSRLVPLCVVVAIALMAAEHAWAQITTQMLIGDAVSEVGSRYGDVDEAIKRFTNRDVLGARTFLETARRKDASLPPPDLLLAKMYFLSGNAAAGRASLERTAMEDPGDPEAYLILADQAIQQRRLIEAESLYDKGLALAQKFDGNAKRKRNAEVRSRTGRALVAEQRKDWQDAAADLQALLKIDPDNATAHYRLGRSLFMQKQFRDGYNEFVTARKLDKNLPDPYVAAALMYDQLDQQNEAQQAFDRALKANSSDGNTLAAYGQWLVKRGSIEKAESMLAEARKANPENLNILILSGVAARMNKKMKPAEDYFMEALRISPANGDTINQLALLLIEQGDQAKRQRALEFAGISSRLNNESADAQVTLAWVLYQLGRAAEAEQALRNGLQLGSLSPDSSFLVAKVLVDQNRADAAKQILKGALDTETPGIFVNRQEAQALLETLEKE
ncbi:MAG: tetratricopeptide repeat protein [Pirellulales bacterium]